MGDMGAYTLQMTQGLFFQLNLHAFHIGEKKREDERYKKFS